MPTIQLVLFYLFLILPVLEELGRECTVAGQDTSDYQHLYPENLLDDPGVVRVLFP